MRVLVSGFEPFGGQRVNASLEAVRLLPDRIGDASLARVVLPVAFGRDVGELYRAVAEHEPDVCICVGQAGGRPDVSPELVGINYRLARTPDNDGACPVGEPVVAGAPDAYFSTLPVHAIARRIRQAGIPASVSYSAGTFCCNEVLYALMHLVATERPCMRAGFIHVPYLPEQVDSCADVPALSRDEAASALRIAIETCIDIPSGDEVRAADGRDR